MRSTAVRKLKAALRAAQRQLTRAYEQCRQRKTAEAVAVAEVYYLLEKERAAALQDLRGAKGLAAGERGFPHAFEELSACMENGRAPDFFALRAYLETANFTLQELTLTALLLRAALVLCGIDAAERVAKNQQDTDALACLQNVAASLQALPATDFTKLFAYCSKTERLLLQDWGFSCSDEETKAIYRARLWRYARQKKLSEFTAAQNLLARAKGKEGSGYGLLRAAESHRRGKALLCTEALLPLLLACGLGYALHALWLAPLLWLPLFAITAPVLARLFLLGMHADALPMRALGGVVPKEAETVIAVTALLPRPAAIPEMRAHLQKVFLRAGTGAIRVCLLADLRASSHAVCPEDAATIRAAKQMIDELNAQQPHTFMLFVRPRQFSETQGEYTGFARKRGAITAFAQSLRGDMSGFSVCYGATENLAQVRYMFVLDSDTEPDMDCLCTLVAAAQHPENKAQLDTDAPRVTQGYGIFMPRVETALSSAFQTRFSRFMTGTGGLSGYDCHIGERYQDLFGASLFTGKGLLDVDAYLAKVPAAFQAETVLSHDILEGELLRTAFVGSAQVTDKFPASIYAYMARMDRWVRGDAQNAAFLFSRVAGRAGKVKNPFSAISKYKLADNLRRAATPVFGWLLCCISVLLPPAASTVVLLCVLLCVFAEGLCTAVSLLVRNGGYALTSRFYGKTMPAAGKALLDGVLGLLLLPQTAWVCLRALVSGTWRRFVSKKHMLDWVTAADSECTGNFWLLLRKSVPALLSAGWLFWMGGAFARLFALAFFAAPFFCAWSAKAYRARAQEIPAQHKPALLRDAAAMWKYYSDLCNAENHYLPPDNLQLSPIPRTAYRTSPTNIGLMLCACLAARDFCLLSTEDMCEYLSRTLDTVERLERWHGNLYNWYDTKTLVPLSPRYVSAVDSGNFLCCLVALQAGLSEYVTAENSCAALRERIEAILQSTSLAKLYDDTQNLFYIGYDAEKNTFTPAHYDLLMSESRMMSYYAVSAREVPKKHWGALGRVVSKSDGYKGAVSWSGTMFEFFMPYLFLPSPESTLSYEALRYCVHAQAGFAHKNGIPFGISESGYYRFDEQLNYQYKAHGVPVLGLRHADAQAQRVVSPYATYLCLPFVPKTALKALDALKKLNLEGEYGLFEAMDFTQSPQGQVVRSFMAHHVGMSLLSIDNVLNDGTFQKRFLRDSRMQAGVSLLEERPPEGAPTFRQHKQAAPAARPEKPKAAPTVSEQVSPIPTRVQIYDNGTWTTLLADVGTGHAQHGGVQITRRSRGELDDLQGVFAVLQTPHGALPLCRAIDPLGTAGTYACAFADTFALYTATSPEIVAQTTVTVHKSLPAEQRSYTIQNRTSEPLQGTLLLYWEPSMSTYRAETAHKAFQKLFVTAQLETAQDAVVFARRTEAGEPERFCGCAFGGHTPFACALERDRVLQRGAGVHALLHATISGKAKTGAADVCFAAAVPVALPAHGETTVVLHLCAASSREALLQRLSGLQREKPTEPSKGCPALFPAEPLWQANILPRLFFNMPLLKSRRAALQNNRLGIDGLFRLGISGDVPILTLQNASSTQFAALVPYLQGFARLRAAGLCCDLVLLFAGGETEKQTLTKAIADALQSESQPQLQTAAGKLHLLSVNEIPAENREALLAFSDYLGDAIAPPLPEQVEPFYPIVTQGTEKSKQENGLTETGYRIAQKPVLPWCYVLSNPTFSTLVGDKTLGASFAINARLNKLTRFTNDAMLDNPGERLFLQIEGQAHLDLLENAVAHFGAGEAVYETTVDALQIRVRVYVPARGMCKITTVTLQNTGAAPQTVRLCLYTQPALCEDGRPSPFLQSAYVPGRISVWNPCNTAVPGTLCLHTEAADAFYTVSELDFKQGRWDSGGALPQAFPCAALGRILKILPHQEATATFTLSFGHTAQSAAALCGRQLLPAVEENRIVLESPDQALNALFNLFLVNQIQNGRVFARTGFYQSGGAYGFRDQLQDVAALMLTHKTLCRRQILRCCAAQFQEGDVLHWWHPLPTKTGHIKGVRTRYSDDLLWLPFVLSQYVRRTGDVEILEVEIPFLAAEPLQSEETERYFDARRGEEKGTVLEHAIRAVRCAMRFGEHGLLRMGAGDWNDSFNRVGAKGRGESVWLSQFAVTGLVSFIPVLQAAGQAQLAAEYQALVKKLRASLEETAWDTDRYLRAFYDDGEKMGAPGAPECSIDSLTQSFAVFAEMPQTDRVRTALQTAYRYLVDETHGVVRLFAPAFSGEEKKAGYVAKYPPGIRENGGQYTHAAVWFCRALFQAGLVEEGETVLQLLNPLCKYEDPEIAKRYKTEPYYLAGDVYAAKGLEGRGGWSLYTGSAGHFYALVAEGLLGIRQTNGALSFRPNPPKSWGAFQFTLCLKGARITVKVAAQRHGEMLVDGVLCDSLRPDGKNHIVNLM